MNKLKNVIVLVVLILLIIVVVVYTNKQSEKQHLLDRTTKPFIATIVNKKIISGNLYPIKEIEINSPISGILEKYYVHIGNKVKKGDKLAIVKLLPEPAQLEIARKNLNAAKITFENDKTNYERDKGLVEKGVISKVEFEQSSKTYLISKEQYTSAVNQLCLLEEGHIPLSNISNIVLAAVDGTIIDVPLEEGEPVVERNNYREGSTIVVIAKLDSFLFKGSVIESDVITLKKGMKIMVSPTSKSDCIVEAFISKISPRGQSDQGIMKYKVEAVMKIPDSITIYSGFNATAEIILEKKENVLVVEEKNVVFKHDSAFVEVVSKDGKVEKRYVKTGISDGLNIEIINGLDKNDKIKITN